MPTNRDVFETIISEVTGKTLAETREIMRQLPHFNGANIDKEISQSEFDALITNLRKEKSGILNWVLDGLKKST